MARKHVKETFVFAPELGRRLAQLRKRAGLDQRQLGLKMGRKGQAAGKFISRLERGKRRFPSLALIADYLRACRAGFADIADILDRYTAQLPVDEVAVQQALAWTVAFLPKETQKSVLAYERKTEGARQARTQDEAQAKKKRAARVETIEQRQARIRRMYGKQYAKQALEQELYGALAKLGKSLPASNRRATCEHGRRVFSVLVRTAKDPMRRVKGLEQLASRIEQEGLDKDAARMMAEAARAAYDKLVKEGRIGWQPVPEEMAKAGIGMFATTVKAEARYDMDAAGIVNDYWKRRRFLGTYVALEVNRRLEAMRVETEMRRRFVPWVERLFSVCIDRGVEAMREEARPVVEQHADAKLAQSVVDQVADEFEKLKDKLPQQPEQADRQPEAGTG